MSGWKPSDAGQGEFLRTQAGLREALHTITEKIKVSAESAAPVGDPASDPHPGQYRDSFRTEVEVGRPAKGQDRLIGHVYNEAPHAAAVEYGYSGRADSPGRHAHHTLANAIEAARE
jgi:hypothetical protein